MRLRLLLAATAAVCCTACWDFVEPDFPEAGAPAVLQANALLEERGRLSFSALLAPGLAEGGVQRRVLRDTLEVFGLKLAPVEIRRNGSRSYSFNGDVAVPAVVSQPFELRAPVVEGIAGPPPHVRWFSLRKADPDTISWLRGTDLVLRLLPRAGTSVPPPPIQQWFLEVRGSSRSFRLSADSLPPLELHIPAQWIPESDGDTLNVFFSFYQAGQQQSPGEDYIGNFALTVLLHWFVRIVT